MVRTGGPRGITWTAPSRLPLDAGRKNRRVQATSSPGRSRHDLCGRGCPRARRKGNLRDDPCPFLRRHQRTDVGGIDRRASGGTNAAQSRRPRPSLILSYQPHQYAMHQRLRPWPTMETMPAVLSLLAETWVLSNVWNIILADVRTNANANFGANFGANE